MTPARGVVNADGRDGRFVLRVRKLSRRLDAALERVEPRLLRPSGWTTGDYRERRSTHQTETAELARRYQHRFWRLGVQLRAVWAALSIVWAVAYVLPHDATVSLSRTVAASIFLGVWVATTTLWSSYLRALIMRRPALSYVEVASGVAVLWIGGGLGSAFIAYAGLTMAFPGFVAGLRGLFVAWFTYVAVFVAMALTAFDSAVASGLTHQAVHADLVERIAGYTGLAILMGACRYVLDLLERAARIEHDLVPDAEREWVRAVRRQLASLRHAHDSIAPQLRETAYGALALGDAAAAPESLRGQLRYAAALLVDTQTPTDGMPVTLEEIVERARAAVVLEAAERLREIAIGVVWEPEIWARRFILGSESVEPVRRFVREALRNMVKHGQPPFAIRAHVEYARDERIPGAEHEITLVFDNGVRGSRPAKSRVGLRVLEDHARALGGELQGPRVFDSRWNIGLRFTQAALPDTP